MKKIFNRKLNKMGFTLAELLIVVAIIAILVAIASPLFVGALDKAEKAAANANIRAIRAAAVNEILLNQTKYEVEKNVENGWDVEAVVTSGGDISSMSIKAHTDDDTFTTAGTASKDDGAYTVKILIKELTVTGA